MSLVVAALAVATAVLLAWSPTRSVSGRLRAVTPAPPPARSPRSAGAGHGDVRLGRLRERYSAHRLAPARRQSVVEVTYALAAELRSGRPPGAALAAAAAAGGPLAGPLAEAAAAAAAGAAASDELRRLARHPGCSGLSALAAAWEVTERVGGPIADVLDRLGESLDAEAEADRAIAAILAGPRATMLLLAVLPAFGVVLGQSIGAAPVALLLHRPLGWGLLAAAAVLDVAGLVWIERLARRVTRP